MAKDVVELPETCCTDLDEAADWVAARLTGRLLEAFYEGYGDCVTPV